MHLTVAHHGRAADRRSRSPFGHAGKSSWSCSDRLNPVIDELSKAIEQEGERRPEVQLLMTHPGVGPISKQGNALMRSLLEAAQVIAPCEPEWRQHCFHLVLRRGRAIAKEALARKRAVRLFWMWRKGQNQQVKKFGSHAGQLETPKGVEVNHR